MTPIEQSSIPHSPDSPIENPKSKIENHLPTLFPPAQLTLLLGQPGTGKSLLSLDLAARLSRGAFLDHNTNAPAHTLIASREDDAFTISDRLHAAGAVTAHITQDNTASLIPESPNEIAPLIQRLEKRRYALVILDPLPAFLGTFDCNHTATVRRLLEPLLQTARHFSTAIVGIIHHNKSRRSPHTSPFDTIAGSHAYTALARSVLSVTTRPYLYHHPHPNPNPSAQDPTVGLHYLTPIKLNAAPITHTFPFSIESTTTNSENPQSTPAIHWHTPLPLAAETQPEILSTHHFEQSQLELACDFLRTALAHGPLPAAALQKQARSLAISPRTLYRARQYIPLQYSHNGLTGTWQVALANLKPHPECRQNLSQLEPTLPVAVRAHDEVASQGTVEPTPRDAKWTASE